MARIGIISDIHGKNGFLRLALAQLKDCCKIVNLGDIVGYNGDVNDIIGQLKDPRIINVLGNHDLEALIDEDSGNISQIQLVKDGKELPLDYGVDKSGKSFIRSFSLRKYLRFRGKVYSFSHSYAKNNNPSLIEDINEGNIRNFLMQTKADFNFVGGSHVSKVITLEGDHYNEEHIDSEKVIKLKYGKECVINVGSLSTNKGGVNLLNYAVLNPSNDEVSFFYADPDKLLSREHQPMDFAHLRYPILGKGHWHLTELTDKATASKSTIFSKSYFGFIMDVMIINNHPKNSFDVHGRVLNIDGYTIRSSSRKFYGPDAFDSALEHAATIECQNAERTAEHNVN